MKKYVYRFGGGTADGDGTMKDVLGGKGAGLAEMCGPACPCLPDSRSRRKSATSSSRTATRCPQEIDDQMAAAPGQAGRPLGKKLGDAAEPAAAQRALGREVLHARHDEHHPQPRPERQDHRGTGGQDRQPALCLRLLPPLHPDVRRSRAEYRHGEVRSHLRRAQAQGQDQARYRSQRRRPAGDHRGLQEARQEGDQEGLPAGRAASS